MSSRISLCMIVKNEARNLRRCLTSVTGVVDEIIVVDTGSTDDTCQVAREFGAKVQFFPWGENFSDARNASLALATGDWVLFLDADEELAGESKEALQRLTATSEVEGYFIKIINYLGNEGWTEACPDLVFRLFRNNPEYRFRGAIHEQVVDVILEKNRKAAYRLAEEIVIFHYGYLDQQIEEKDKKNRNLKIIRRELQENPANNLVRYHYGVELFRGERYAEAAEEFTRVANGIDPNTIYFPKLMRYLVMARKFAGQTEQALKAALLGLQFFPNYADLYYYAGLICLESRQYDRAHEYFQKAVSMPEQPAIYASFGGVRGFRSYYHLGEIAEVFLNDEEALKYYLASLRDNPDFSYALENIIKILNPRENPVYTKECLEKVFDLSSFQAGLTVGEIFFRHGAYSLTLEYLERVRAGQAASAQVQFWQAFCLIQTRRYLEALRILSGFTPESPFYPLVKFNELFCFWVQGKKRKVRILVEELRILGLTEDTENILNLFLKSLEKRKTVRKISLGSEGTSLLLDIVQRLLDLKEIDRVEVLLGKVDPQCLTGQRMPLARLFYRYGLGEKAAELLQEHLLTNRDGEAHYLLGEIFQAAGHYLEAEQHYRYAIEINPEEPRYYIRRINLYDHWRNQVILEAVAQYPDVELFKKLAEGVTVAHE